MRSSIWLADLARAYETLRPGDPETRVAIAEMLGFDAREDSIHHVDANATPGHDGPVGRSATTLSGRSTRQTPAAAPPEILDDTHPGVESPTARLIGFEETGFTVERRPGRHHEATLATTPHECVAAAPPHVPLLPPSTANSLLERLLARADRDGPLDVPALVETVATRRVPREFPRRPVPTLRFGVQVLVDVGESMTPFTDDQDHIVGQIRRLVGAERTTVRYFADAPLRGAGTGPIWTWRAYEPPPSPTRIVLLSTLGIGGSRFDPARSEPPEWVAFSRLITRHGCDAVALVPYPRARHPRWLTSLFTVVVWDRDARLRHANVVPR